jgi:hypothetical protein
MIITEMPVITITQVVAGFLIKAARLGCPDSYRDHQPKQINK